MKRHLTSILLAVLVFLAPQTLASVDASKLPNLAPMLSKVMPSVVNIEVQGFIPVSPTPRRDKKNDRPRRNNRPRKFESIGSGVVMNTAKGYVITNAHVVRNAKTITVTLNDGRRLKAKLLGTDPGTDIAVVQVKSKNLKAISIGDSNRLTVGQFVIAIGNPFNLNIAGDNQTATFGIISALGRADLDIEGFENFIQTDAAINPGNSGGALVNMQGEVIGINTAIISPYGGNIGIGFAIPINMVRDVMQQIIQYGSIKRGMMGIFVQRLTPELSDAFGLPAAHGALVSQVNQGSPAQRAGLKAGDIIQDINGVTITDSSQVKNIVGLLRVGSSVRMKILRNGQPLRIQTKVADVRKHEDQLQAENPFLFGLALRDFDQENPMQGHITGIQVVGVSENSAGWRAQLMPGDVIIAANKQRVKTLEGLRTAAAKSKTALLVHVLRGPGSLYLVLK